MPPSAEERAFLKEIQRHPTDVAPRLVYADWLEEQNDPRAGDIRANCQCRLPFTRSELKWVRLDIKADDTPVRLEATPTVVEGIPLLDSERPRLEDDIGHISSAKVCRNFPRDDQGRIKLKTTVVLEAYIYGKEADVSVGQDPCLVAIGPERRKDEQEIRLQVIPAYVMHHEHGWQMRRDLWDDRVDEPTESPLLLDPKLPELAPFGDTKQLEKFRAAQTQEKLSEIEKQALTLLLLDHARFEEALQLWGLFVSPEVTRMLNMEEFSIQGGGGCDCRYEGQQLNRGKRLRRTLWEMAPWNLSHAMKLHETRANARRKQKKPSELYLYIVPKQTHSRRARLSIVHGLRQQLGVDFRFAGSNVQPWRWTWTRPREFDAGRM